MNIVVLAGGLSVERDVSLSSGSMVCAALKRLGHNPLLVDAFFGLEDVPADIRQLFVEENDAGLIPVGEVAPDLDKVRKLRGDSGLGEIGKNIIEVCRAADIVYMGLHGDNGENGRMQAFFDLLGIRYTGAGYLGSALAMHKGVAKQMMADAGVPCPDGKVFRREGSREGAEGFGFPCVVKPCSGGSSIGVALPKDATELQNALDEAFALEEEVVVEAYIKGREFSVGVLGDTVLPPIEIIPREGFYDYAHKYQAGWTEEVCPADITPEQDGRMQDLAKKAFDALRLEVYARGEFILDENGGLHCLEMNTLPGMTPTSLLPQEAAAVGIGYDELCERIIRLSLAKYEGE